MTALVLGLVGGALAATATLVAEEGELVPGRPAELNLVLWDEDATLPTTAVQVSSPDGEVRQPAPSGRPGLWTLGFVPDVDARDRARFSITTAEGDVLETELALAEASTARLDVDSLVEGEIGRPVTLKIRGGDLPEPKDLQVSMVEGRLLRVEGVEDGLELEWMPGVDTQPRVVSLGLRDGRLPGALPAWVEVPLVAKKPIAITTEPGATMSIEVAGRRYGPVKADASGQASLRVSVRPGVRSGVVIIEDALGNVQRQKLNLAQAPSPSLAILAEGDIVPGAPMPPLHLFALAATGGPWQGEAPSCRGSNGAMLQISESGDGSWIAVIPPIQGGAFLDLRVECSLPEGRATASTRLAVGSGIPARVALRVWPEELSTDFPVAQIQAWIEDSGGYRLPPDGLSVEVSAGTLSAQEVLPNAVRADFKGDPLAPIAEVWARWDAPAGEGLPWNLRVGGQISGDAVDVQVRALDRVGRPLPAVPLQVQAGDQQTELVSDSKGWATVQFTGANRPTVVEVRSGAQVRRLLLVPGEEPRSLEVGAPDLVDVGEVRLLTGRVRKVLVETEPSTLTTGDGSTASVRVSLLDNAGRPVVDEKVKIEASRGVVTAPVVQADGSLLATYAPPPGVSAGTVELTVQAPDSSFPETGVTLELVPRTATRAPAVGVGGITNLGSVGAPLLTGDIEQRLPWFDAPVYVRLGVGWYQDRRTVEDTDRLQDIDLQMHILPVTLSAQRRWAIGLWGAWAGAGPVLSPYLLRTNFGNAPTIQTGGVHRIGGGVHAGVGYRIRPGEVFVEGRWVGLLADDAAVGYSGQLGGLAGVAGFRVVY